MNASDISALMKAHGVSEYTLNGGGHSGVESLPDGRWKMTFGGMPNLKFFVDLAALAGVPIESIETDSEDNGPGCDTCGYGGGTEFFAYLTPAQNASKDDRG